MLTNLALDRPLVGGGFDPYTAEVFRRYLPDYDRIHAAHSIYFQVLGEHGFVGLALFIVFWMLTWQIKSSHHQTHKERSAVEVGVLACSDDSGEFDWLLRRRHVS